MNYLNDGVLPIDDLLARIRACIVDAPTEEVVSLTINFERAGATTVFRISVQRDGRLMSLSAARPASSPSAKSKLPPSPQQAERPAAPQDTSKPSVNTEMDDEEDSSNEMDVERGSKECSPQQSAVPDGPKEAQSTSSSEQGEAGIDSVAQLSSRESIRRSARQQHPPDRLAYPGVTSTPIVKRVVDAPVKHGTKRTTEAQESTDAEGSDSDSSSSSTRSPQRKQQKKHLANPISNANVVSSDSSDEEQIAALVMKLKEAHAQRYKEPDMEGVSKKAILQLGRDILGDGGRADVDALVYKRCSPIIDNLISTSTAMRMLGYYLRGALATRLKRSHKNKYVRSARDLLGLKSTADTTACPAFYSFVQEHCPSITSGTGGTMDIEALLREPLFLADIGWAEWRRYLGKPHLRIIQTAMEQFKASLQPPLDWMQRGWVEECNDARFGRGVRAVRDIPYKGVVIAADLAVLLQAQAGKDMGPPKPWYRIEWDGGKQQLEAQHLWVGMINHLPMPHCNLKLMGNGKLVQHKPSPRARRSRSTIPYSGGCTASPA